MIFAEHKLFSEKIPLLEHKIYNLEQVDSIWRESDSIKSQIIYYCKQQINESNKSIERLSTSIKSQKQRNIICYSTTGIAILLCLLIR